MKYGTIPGLEGKKVSQLVFGTLFLHNTEAPDALLDEVWGLGCNTFDCAAIYGGGVCESVLGGWLKRRGLTEAGTAAREGIVIITKGGCNNQDQLWSANLSPQKLEGDIKGSLERLGLDSVDLFMLHRDDRSMPVSDIVDMMDGFRAKGKYFTCWGVSNWDVDRLRAAIDYAKAAGKAVPVCDSLQVQNMFDSAAGSTERRGGGTPFDM